MPCRSYPSRLCDPGRSQRAGKIDDRHLKACMAVATGVRIRAGFVVMEQAPKQPKNDDCNDGESLSRELASVSPFWTI